MTILLSERFCFADFGTYSVLHGMADGESVASWLTVEQPWNDNIPFKSCVPCGEYRLEPDESQKYGPGYAFVNEDLNVFHLEADIPDEFQGIARYETRMHGANAPSQLQGCIAPGKNIGFFKDQWAVMNSGKALKEIHEFIEWHAVTELTITVCSKIKGLFGNGIKS